MVAQASTSLNCLSAECSIESFLWLRFLIECGILVSIAFRLNVRLRVAVFHDNRGEGLTLLSQLPFG